MSKRQSYQTPGLFTKLQLEWENARTIPTMTFGVYVLFKAVDVWVDTSTVEKVIHQADPRERQTCAERQDVTLHPVGSPLVLESVRPQFPLCHSCD